MSEPLRLATERDVYSMEWRVCDRFPDYSVSECGDLRRTDPKLNGGYTRLRGTVDTDGYLRYKLTSSDGKKYFVTAYRLVAEAFIGPRPSPRHEVAHNNGSRIGCYFRDLRWATRKENDDDRIIHGTAVQRGENNPRAKITEADVIDIRSAYRAIKLGNSNQTIHDLRARYGLCAATVVRIAKGDSWTHIPLEIEQ
jgi:hypothetical protein